MNDKGFIRYWEYKFLIKHLDLKKVNKILDVGCCETNLPVYLASKNQIVEGIDLLDFPFAGKNFTFSKMDARSMTFQNEIFDYVLGDS